MNTKNNDHLALYGLLSSLGLSPAMRNDQAILEALEKGEPVDHIQGLNEAGLLDPFFEFLKEADIFPCVKKVSALSYRRVMAPIVLLVLTYMTKILIGVPFMNALPDVLFSKVSIMRLLGFNAHLIENGLCRRGEHARKNCEPNTDSLTMVAGVGSVRKLKIISIMWLSPPVNIAVSCTSKNWPFF